MTIHKNKEYTTYTTTTGGAIIVSLIEAPTGAVVHSMHVWAISLDKKGDVALQSREGFPFVRCTLGPGFYFEEV